MNHDISVVSVREDNQALSPYSMFKYSIRSEITRQYYERRLRKFLDFVQFNPKAADTEKRCNDFAEQGKQSTNWALNRMIRFLQYQKERVEVTKLSSYNNRRSLI